MHVGNIDEGNVDVGNMHAGIEHVRYIHVGNMPSLVGKYAGNMDE